MVIIGNMANPIRFFAIVTLLPAAFLGLGAILGGLWVALAVIYLTALTSLLDRLVQRVDPAHEFPSGTSLSVALALVHLSLMPLIVWALSGDAHSFAERAGLFFAAGLFFGQVSNANAHELIHRRNRFLHDLGMWVYISMLFGHHTSAHVLIHHRFVATPQDPNTSRRGESFYRYALRAWLGSFRQGFRAETARLAKIGRARWRNPYVVYVGGALAFIGLALLLGGPKAMIAYISLAGYAQMQLLMSDYVQHYGLVRRIGPDGRPEPVAAHHSWNSPHWFSSALLLNATRHSDHHAHPGRPYPALSIPPAAPTLPRPLPLMASVALLPPLWRRMMDHRADRWRDA